MRHDLIDFHTHILPGVDDGSGDVTTSLEMLRRQWEQGVGHVVLTPHFYPEDDTPEHFLAKRDGALRQLSEAMEQTGSLPQVYTGAEVAYFRGMSECDELHQLCVHGTKYILVELPMAKWDEKIFRELAEIRHKQGLTPVIAHVDRYLPRFGAKRMVETLLRQPVLIQANAGAFFRRGSAALMLQLLEKGMIHLLGSDSHDLSDRVPNLGQAAERIVKALGSKVLEQFNEVGQSILQIPVSV